MTKTSDSHSPIVVGVDGSDVDQVTLAWAADEATRTSHPLHVLHSHLPEFGYGEAGMFAPLPAIDVELLEESAREILALAVQRVRSLAPDATVTSELVHGSPAAALVHASRTASLVVTGGHAHSALSAALLGSVSLQVAAHSHCPVIVVKDVEDRERPRAGVLVGIDGSQSSQDCLRFAFEQASSRGTSLEVLHAWAPPVRQPSELLSPILAAAYEVEPRERLTMAEALSGWQQDYPGVAVQQTLVRAPTVEALLKHADGVQLLVVGSRGRGGFAGLLLGSVSQRMLDHAGCPVAVIRGA